MHTIFVTTFREKKEKRKRHSETKVINNYCRVIDFAVILQPPIVAASSKGGNEVCSATDPPDQNKGREYQASAGHLVPLPQIKERGRKIS